MGREIGNPLALVAGIHFLSYLNPMYTKIDSSRRYYAAKPAGYRTIRVVARSTGKDLDVRTRTTYFAGEGIK